MTVPHEKFHKKVFTLLKILMVLQWFVVVMDYTFLNYFLKPSVVGLMFLFTLFFESKNGTICKLIMAAGFFFSVMGDALLLVEGLNFFLLGLVSFALAHISFVLAYIRDVEVNIKQTLTITLPIIVFNFTIGNFMFQYLTSLPNFQEFMVVPLGVYIFLISMNVVVASMRVNTTSKSYYQALIGGYFFVASDSILSLNVFAGFKQPIVLFLIMFTYYVSEYLILRSTVEHLNYLEYGKQDNKLSKNNEQSKEKIKQN